MGVATILQSLDPREAENGAYEYHAYVGGDCSKFVLYRYVLGARTAYLRLLFELVDLDISHRWNISTTFHLSSFSHITIRT